MSLSLARLLLPLLLVITLGGIAPADTEAQPPAPAEVRDALHRAVAFFRTHAASQGGGYVYRVSADLQRREGEGAVGPATAWIEPPGTPAVGMAYLQAYRLTGDELLREAALETAAALIQGQLESGGWDNHIEFDPQQRRNYAYRAADQKGRRNVTTLDDDKSQSAARFLMMLDQTLQFSNDAVHEAVTYALDSFLSAQYAVGAWPQRYSGPTESPSATPKRASLPENWPREYPAKSYGDYYTLNDNTMSDMIDTLLLAHQIYGDARYLDAVKRAGEFLIRAQLPEPQPGWAQQYDHNLQPAWARKFEPPAICGGESQGVMRTLMRIYRTTGDAKYLEPIPRALAYYRRIQLPGGQLARFYELGTDRPLYFTKDYQLTYSDDDMPTHYAFKVGSRLDAIQQEYERCLATPPKPVAVPVKPVVDKPRMTDSLARRAQQAVAALDDRGAWVQNGRMRYHGADDPTRRVIESRTFATNLLTLAQYLAASEN